MAVYSVDKINTFKVTEKVFGSNSNRNALHVLKNFIGNFITLIALLERIILEFALRTYFSAKLECNEKESF